MKMDMQREKRSGMGGLFFFLVLLVGGFVLIRKPDWKLQKVTVVFRAPTSGFSGRNC